MCPVYTFVNEETEDFDLKATALRFFGFINLLLFENNCL